MATPIKTGWLNDQNGDKFAPKTLVSQVQTNDGTLLEEKLQQEYAQKENVYTKAEIDNKLKDVPTGGGGSDTIISDEEPDDAAPGTLWLDTSETVIAYAEGVGF